MEEYLQQINDKRAMLEGEENHLRETSDILYKLQTQIHHTRKEIRLILDGGKFEQTERDTRLAEASLLTQEIKENILLLTLLTSNKK